MAHDPLTRVWVNGRFDRDRWPSDYRELFAMHQLVRNRRATAGISLSAQCDAALAVVDVDTLWELLIMHTGLLQYA